MGDTTLGCRSNDFGDITIKGFLNGHASCLLITWKRLEGVVMLAITMLYSAASCKYLSGRALECSGALPFISVGQ